MYDPFEAEDAAAVADERYRREEEERHRAAEVEEEEADWRRRSREWNRDGRYEHPGYDASNKRPSVEQNAHHYAREEEAREPPPKQPRNEVAEEQKMTIWVGNLPPGTKAIDIRELVSPYARVINCKVGMNKSQGSLFSLVTLNGSDASRCIAALNQTDFNGSQIDVRKIKT
ncbi:hypothetical protein CAPTEDRAFT_219866 [Capitella teleta]|uniref:RRM domain-containing protein n=1 Tax=Capitella teleta TaxID=283909 RepID=R7VLH4_CAPTE|nr:hypothetical protein CAPTEDRAFT_219866 [Capitella teleta]|eukprot:ELU17625.1 hypothetical protein CAPTEDRAFT_219866 [Capitella teleta]